MAASTLRFYVDLIGSKKLATQAGGLALIATLCSQMKTFLESAMNDRNINRSFSIKCLDPRGDDIVFELKSAREEELASLAVAAVKRAFIDCPVGRRFRYVICQTSGRSYEPAIGAFDNITKNPGCKPYHIAIDRRVVSALPDGDDSAWLNGASRTQMELTFSGEAVLGVKVDLYCPLVVESVPPDVPVSHPPQSRWQRVLTLTLVCAIVAAIAAAMVFALKAGRPRRGQGAGSVGVAPREPAAALSSIVLARIEPGTFVMGTAKGEESGERNQQLANYERQHTVTLTRPFYMGTTEVTQAQWREVMGTNPSKKLGDTRPVECVTWDDAMAFCRELSKMEGKAYRLPTEAEWEYACRAGTMTRFHFGDKLSINLANFDNSGESRPETPTTLPGRDQTTPVGSFPPNRFGLYDMHGNVFEWCLDSERDYPTDDRPVKDPEGRPDAGDGVEVRMRSLRGGAWSVDAAACRSGRRLSMPADLGGKKESDVGFRVVLDP